MRYVPAHPVSRARHASIFLAGASVYGAILALFAMIGIVLVG